MKKKILTICMAAVMTLTICSCGNAEPEKSDNAPVQTESETNVDSELSGTLGQSETAEQGEATEQIETAESEVDTFSFDDLKNFEFCFSSGAGGWATLMNIREDGSFSGEYFDGELGVTGEEYPNGTMYQCEFDGQFSQPIKINDYTYSVQILALNYADEVGKEEIKDGMLYCYTDVYGLDGAEDILIYLPGAPLAELPEEFRSWIGYYDLSSIAETELPFYALNNEAQEYGFSSYDVIESLKNDIAATEECAVALETSIQNDPLTQTEYNEKTKELYDMWDFALNQLWKVLSQTMDKEKMDALTVEEREWIALKEQAVADAGAAYEGGSMQAMVMNQKAAEMTEERVYELLELLNE